MKLHFYEKPGCINNTKQKQILNDKGYDLVTYNILEEPWTKELLLKFMEERPVNECFNMSAPRIKSGEVNIEDYDKESAVLAMMKDPFLIKRPLIQYGNKFGCGFDSPLATELINGINVDALLKCPRLATNSCDNLEKK